MGTQSLAAAWAGETHMPKRGQARRRRGYSFAALLLFLKIVIVTIQPSHGLAAQPLRLEDIFSEHGLEGPTPTQFQWSPDGKWLSYILAEQESGRRDLWAASAESGEKKILVSYEQLRNLAERAASTQDEREKERLLRYAVASYLWSPDSKSLLFTNDGRLFLHHPDTQKARPIAPEKQGVRDAKFSPNGRWISFLYEHDIWLAPAAGGAERALTSGASDRLLHGDLDWIYPEEFGVRTGYHWSPDSARIAFLELNQEHVPEFPITYLTPSAPRLELQHYPKPGDPNPIARVGIVEAKPRTGRQPDYVWVKGHAEYTPRIDWADATTLAIQRLNRRQNELQLLFVDAHRGRPRRILKETDPYWINVTDDLTFLRASRRFLWTSERTGFRHIEVYGFDGRREAVLTKGEWEVSAIRGVDEGDGWVYYTSNEDQPLGKDLYRIRIDGTGKERLTKTTGTHVVKVNPTHTAYLDSHSSLRRPGRSEVRSLEGGKSLAIHEAPSLSEYGLVKPELIEWTTDDHALVRGMLLRPRTFEPGRRHPVLMYVYGGPHVPTIRDAWGSRGRPLFHQYLAQKGYAVFYVDDRTSSRLGHKYEAAARERYGPVAVKDYEFAVRQIQKMNFVDPERIGIWGWSGGGFSTCFALTHSKLFKLGIAMAPVTDWRLYDSIYTERYMGLPSENGDAYDATSAVKAADRLHGRLLLVHPTVDDNVHFQNTIQMIDALIQAGKSYDLLLYPGKTHSLHGEKERLHLFRSIEKYLDEHL